jgi:inner membrane protein
MEYLEQITFWHWLILGVGLVVLEALAPGIIFLWMGIAALVTGIVVLVLEPLSWQTQVLVFAGLSIVSVVAGRMWVKSRPTETDHPMLNRRGEQYVGRIFTLSEAIVNGSGKLWVDDTTWKVAGNDLPEGSRVKVVGTAGTVLQVVSEEE